MGHKTNNSKVISEDEVQKEIDGLFEDLRILTEIWTAYGTADKLAIKEVNKKIEILTAKHPEYFV